MRTSARYSLGEIWRQSGARRRVTLMRPVQPSAAFEIAYRRILFGLVDQVAEYTEVSVLPLVRREPEAKAEGGTIKSGLAGLRQITDLLTASATSMTDRIIDLEGARHTVNFADRVKDAIGIDMAVVIASQPGLDDALALAAATNTGLIKSLSADVVKKVEQAVIETVTNGDSMKTLQAKLEKEFGVTKSRAKLIARDQSAKITSNLNQFRQMQAGVEEYDWSTSKDERVRPTHRANEGKRFRWDTPPPATGHPGHDVQCRCVPLAVIKWGEDDTSVEAPPVVQPKPKATKKPKAAKPKVPPKSKPAVPAPTHVPKPAATKPAVVQQPVPVQAPKPAPTFAPQAPAPKPVVGQRRGPDGRVWPDDLRDLADAVAEEVVGGHWWEQDAIKLRRNAPPEYQKLSSGQVALINWYTGMGYDQLNASLRNGTGDFMTGLIRDALNGALGELKPYKGRVMRGINLGPDDLKKYTIGAVVDFPAFTSTGVGFKFISDVEMLINNLTGVYIDPLSQMAGSEKEVLIPAGARFIVRGMKKSGSRTFIELDEIPAQKGRLRVSGTLSEEGERVFAEWTEWLASGEPMTESAKHLLAKMQSGGPGIIAGSED